MKKQFAFWSYDQFPYVLGGTVTNINAEGQVETEEFGKGNYFTPLRIMPVKAGMIMLQELNKQRDERNHLMHSINELTVNKMRKTLKDFKLRAI
jgi:hypothetical protein